MSYVPVPGATEIWDGEMRPLEVAGRRVLVLRTGGELRAYEDRCAHQGVPLSQGSLCAGVLKCGAHCWEFDAATGAGLNPKGARLKPLPLREEGGQILVDPTGTGAAPLVGPVLAPGPTAAAVIAAIRALNPEVQLVERGAYTRVLCPERCRLTAAAVTAELGRPFRLPGDLELIMPAFKGEMRMSADEASWT
jgi:nitrite reductase/ring-hydroxylating ferredoxin subunit